MRKRTRNSAREHIPDSSACGPWLRAWPPLAAVFGHAGSGHAQAPPPSNAVVLDRVVAVVNNQAILASDVDDEMRLAVLDPGRRPDWAFSRRSAPWSS